MVFGKFMETFLVKKFLKLRNCFQSEERLFGVNCIYYYRRTPKTSESLEKLIETIMEGTPHN